MVMRDIIIDSSAILTALAFCHFIGDWFFQNDWMALNKTKNKLIRAVHVTVYVIPFWFMFGLLYLSFYEAVAIIAWIWITHFVIDSYKPLKFYRRLTGDVLAKSSETFEQAFSTPRGFMVYVTLDQVFHFITLVPVAVYLAVATA